MKRVAILIALALGLISGNTFAYELHSNSPLPADKQSVRHGGRFEREIDHLNRMLRRVRWQVTHYRGDWRLRREVQRISNEVDRVNWRYRHGNNDWRLRRDIERLHNDLHRVEVQLHIRRGDWYRWN